MSIVVKDADGVRQTVPTPNPNGRAADTGSAPVVLATQDKAALDAVGTKLDTVASKQDTGNTSLANIDTAQGSKSDAAATSDTGSFSLIALVKRMLGYQSAGNTSLGNMDTDFGAPADAAATNSTSSWSVIALLKGIFQKQADLLTAANDPTPAAITPGILVQKGDEQITGLSTVKALTVPTGALFAVVQVEGGDVRYRCLGAGSPPTSSLGQKIKADNFFTFNCDLANLRFLQVSGTAIINVQYWG